MKTQYIPEIDDIEARRVNITAHYPDSPDYEYEVRLERLNLDEERMKDINSNNGFIITTRQNIKKDLKSDDSIFSSRFGQTLQDLNPFAFRYHCKCQKYQGRLNNGKMCEVCHTPVKYIGDNFEYFGWICIKDPYVLIHPNLFKSLECLIGPKELNNIIMCDDKVDENGNIIPKEPSKDSPFVGIGIMGLKERIMEVLDFYRAKKPAKKEYYEDIVANLDKLFTHSIPVYTTHLRPYNIDENNFSFEGNNAIYNVLAAQATKINKDKLFINHKGKPQKEILYAMQKNFNEIYADMETVMAGKKGYARSLIGGRFNFCSRVVIVTGPDLHIDEIGLPYATLIELFQQRLVNILRKTYSPAEAYMIWNNARNNYNPIIGDLIESILASEYVGVLFNRNPSIHSESIRQMRVVRMNKDYTCTVPLQVLAGFNADFDGDTLNVMYILDQELLNAAMKVFNPRYAGQISRNDGMFNSNVHHQTDTMICLNSFAQLGRDSYSDQEFDAIKAIQKADDIINLDELPYRIDPDLKRILSMCA